MVQNLSKQRHFWYVPSLLAYMVPLMAALYFFSFLFNTQSLLWGGCMPIAYPSAAMALQQQDEHGFPYYKERHKIELHWMHGI